MNSRLGFAWLLFGCTLVIWSLRANAQTTASSGTTKVSDSLLDCMVGTFKVNLSRSAYHPGPARTEADVARWDKLANGFRQRVVRDGVPIGDGFVGYFDGMDYPDVSATGGYDHTEMSVVDDHAFLFRRKRGGQVTQIATRVYSPDCRTSTVTVIGVDAKDQPLSNTIIWERQD